PLMAEQSGLYRAPASTDSLRERAHASGAAWLKADLGAVRDKAQLLRTIARSGALPGTFGANWDALADGLQDLSWLPAGGYVVHLQHAKDATQSLALHWSTLLEILRQTA